jgi:hypothetical protein
MVMTILKSSTMIKCTPMRPVATAELMRRCDTVHIAQWRGSMANPEATGHRQGVSIHVLLPQRPPGTQKTKQQSKNVPYLLAVLTAARMRRYNTVRIAQQRWSRALIEVTGHPHWASIAANNCNWSPIRRFIPSFFINNLLQKGSR